MANRNGVSHVPNRLLFKLKFSPAMIPNEESEHIEKHLKRCRECMHNFNVLKYPERQEQQIGILKKIADALGFSAK